MNFAGLLRCAKDRRTVLRSLPIDAQAVEQQRLMLAVAVLRTRIIQDAAVYHAPVHDRIVRHEA